MCLSRSEFVIKMGNKCGKITIEKKVQRRGEELVGKNPGGNNRKKQFYWEVELGRKLSVFIIGHSATSSG